MKRVFFSALISGHTSVFGVTYGQLMDAIAAVESDRGATSANVYQLKPIYVRDVCRITGQRITFEQAVGDPAVARACIEAYWDYYGDRYYLLTQKRADAQVLARIHNGGPDARRRRCTRAYWIRVRAELLKGGVR